MNVVFTKIRKTHETRSTYNVKEEEEEGVKRENKTILNSSTEYIVSRFLVQYDRSGCMRVVVVNPNS